MILCNVDIKLQNKIKTKNKADSVQALMATKFIDESYKHAL